MSKFAPVFGVLALIAVLVGVVMLRMAEYEQCRQYHPGWYCFLNR